MDYGRIGVRLMEELETFLFSTEARPLLRLTQPPTQWVQFGIPGAIPPLVFMSRCLIKPRDTFIFLNHNRNNYNYIN
jgi:hypothetical protein